MGVGVPLGVGVGVGVGVGLGVGDGVGVGVGVGLGVGDGVGVGDSETIWMAENFALFTLAVATIFSTPLVTATGNVRCTAAYWPATAQISKFCSTVCPCRLTLKTRLPAAVKYISAKSNVTW